MKRSSKFLDDFRELLDGAKQRQKKTELASEFLAENKVGGDGCQPLL